MDAKDRRKTQIGVQLERWRVREIKHRASELGISMSELVRRLIIEYLEKTKTDK
ncbi:ribbon-helix-helix protein, CopG family [Mesoaciditoga sp.]